MIGEDTRTQQCVDTGKNRGLPTPQHTHTHCERTILRAVGCVARRTYHEEEG